MVGTPHAVSIADTGNITSSSSCAGDLKALTYNKEAERELGAFPLAFAAGQALAHTPFPWPRWCAARERKGERTLTSICTGG